MTDPKHEPVAWFEVYREGEDREYQMVGPEYVGTEGTVPLYPASSFEALTAQLDALKEENERLRNRRLSDDDVQWVTNDIAELGVKIGDQFFFLYKGESLVYGALDPDPTVPPVHDDGTPMHWRPVFKREFGECAHPINYENPNLIGKVSLGDSDQWQVLPAALTQSPLPESGESVEGGDDNEFGLRREGWDD
jgi:hypothetical protein